MTKYNSIQTKTFDGIVHDSKREASRWTKLKLLEKAGITSDLQRQVKFDLLPTQYEECTEVYKRGKNKGKLKQGKVIELGVSYVADFVYIDNATNKMVVEDAKGVRTKDYILKRKMMLYFYGIRIVEV